MCSLLRAALRLGGGLVGGWGMGGDWARVVRTLVRMGLDIPALYEFEETCKGNIADLKPAYSLKTAT